MFKKSLVLAVILSVAGGQAIVWAAGPTLTQQILPLDCLVDTVNNGTGLSFYVTPSDCSKVIGTQTAQSPTKPMPFYIYPAPANPAPAGQMLSPKGQIAVTTTPPAKAAKKIGLVTLAKTGAGIGFLYLILRLLIIFMPK